MMIRAASFAVASLVLAVAAVVGASACGTTPAQQTQVADGGCALVGVVSQGQVSATVCEDLVPIVQPVVDQIVKDLGLGATQPGAPAPKFVRLTRNGQVVGYAWESVAPKVQAAIDGSAKK